MHSIYLFVLPLVFSIDLLSQTIQMPSFTPSCFRHHFPSSGTPLIPLWFAPPPPLANPPGLQTSAPLEVSLSYPQFSGAVPVAQATIYYSLDGQDPDPVHSLPYTVPITITTDTILKTLAVVTLTPGSFEGPPESRFMSSVGTFRYHFDDRPWGNAREIENSAGMRFRFIPITPQIATAFYMGAHEVTQAQWDNVMGAEPASNNPSSLLGANRPVENVSWYDAKKFILALNTRENTSKYRLPTRKEWEAIASFYAPISQTFAHGPVSAQICLHGHYGPFRNWQGTILGHSTIGTLLPNGFGVFDIWGNVTEWVEDAGSNQHNRYVCGCGWDHHNAKTCSLINSCRQAWPHSVHTNIGFRVASDL